MTQHTFFLAMTPHRTGELLVSTFTAGMHPQEPISRHILPVIMSWHLGIELVHLAGASTGQLDPEKFWFAWERGAEGTTDVSADSLPRR